MKIDPKWKQGYIDGLKSLLAPNAILLILFNSANQYGNFMASSILGKYALTILNISAAAVGACASIYSLGGLLFRAPSGKLVDERDPRKLLSAALGIKLLVFLAYGFVPEGNLVLYAILRFVHGVTWSFIGVCGPALLAFYVDSSAIGSAYALYLGIQQLVISSSKAVSITIFNRFGPSTAFLACAAETLLPILLVGMMRPTPQKSGEEGRKAAARVTPRKRTGEYICWRLVPLCMISSLPMMTYAAESTFLPALCDSRAVEYLGMLTLATGLSGFVSVLVGVLCDIIDPYILCILTLLTNGLGLFLVGGAETTTTMSVALLLYYGMGKSFNAPFTVVGMKALARGEEGAFSGTNLFIDDACTLIAGLTTGLLAEVFGIGMSFRVIGSLPLLGVAIMIGFKRWILPKAVRN